MLQQPTKEKLYALRLHGMIEAIERQEQDEAARELGFLDRLALLIDQQWSWRENQALTRRVKASRLRGAACVEDIDYRVERGLNKSVIRGLAQESGWVRITNTSSCSGQPASGKVMYLRHWRRKPAGMAIRFTTSGPQRCSAIYTWPEPMAVFVNCSNA